MSIRGALAVAGLVAFGFIAACVGDDPDPGSGSSSGAASSGGSCTDAQKTCNGACVSKEDPNVGCATGECSPCEAKTNAAPACKSGACSFACNPGFADCDGDPANGCESGTSADAANCGACGNACGAANTASATKCEAGKCVFACTTGFAHCGSKDDSGCDTNIDTASEHCGACGHSCLGGECAGGKCKPFLVVGVNSPTSLAVDAKHVYITSSALNYVRRVDHAGKCAGATCPEEFAGPAAGDSLGETRGPTAIASDGTNVWFVASSGVVLRPAAGGALKRWGPAYGDSPGMLATAGGKVFWTTNFPVTDPATHLYRSDLDGSNIVGMATFEVPAATYAGVGNVAADATTVFWTSSGTGSHGVYKADSIAASCTEGASATCTGIGSPNAVGIALDATNVYWTTPASIEQGSVHRRAKNGVSAELLAQEQDLPTGIAVFDGYVYWANLGTGATTGGTIRRAKTNAPTCAGASCELVMAVPKAGNIVAGDDGVYWTNDESPGGGVWRLAK